MSQNKERNLSNIHDSKPDRISLFLIIFLIIFDVVCDNMILAHFGTGTSYKEMLMFMGLLVLQIIASPVQTGYFDFYGRKKGLIFSLSATFLGLSTFLIYSSSIFPFFVLLILVNCIKGVCGNTTPIVWSAIGHTESKNERYFFAISEAGYAIGFLVVLFVTRALNESVSFGILVLISSVLIFLCKKNSMISTQNDNKEVSFKEFLSEEPALILDDIKDKKFDCLGAAFILWEISIYSILIFYADLNSKDIPYVAISMMIGYLVGSIAMKYLTQIINSKMIKIGYLISVISLIPYLLLSVFLKNFNFLLGFGCFFHAIGNAILSPTLLSIISDGSTYNQKSRRLGILNSIDNFAFIIASFASMFYKKHGLTINYLVAFSFLTMLISWIPYKCFDKRLK